MMLGELVIMLLMRRARKEAPRDSFSGERVLKYGWAMRGLSVLFASLILILLLGFLLSDEPGNRGLVVGMVALCLLGGFDVLETFGVSIRLGDGSIVGHAPWRTPRTIAWQDVQRVAYSGSMRWFVITGTGGTKIRISEMISGLGTLASEVRARLDPQVYGKAASAFSKIGA